MALATKHQVIWKRKGTEHSGLELDLPKIIKSDIGFQLMFGPPTNYNSDKEREEQHHLKYKEGIEIMTIEDVIRNYK
jgi:hypothetical protein